VAAVAAAAVLVIGVAVTVLLVGEDEACGCANPDAGLDVSYGTLGPDADPVHARLEVVEVAAVDGYTRTVLHFSNAGDEDAAFDPAYFLGGAGPGDGFRIWDPATGRLYGNRPDLGTVTGDEQVWEPRVRYEIVLYSAPLEPGTETVEVRGPRGEVRIPDVDVRGGAGDAEPLWTPRDAEGTQGTRDDEGPGTVPLRFDAPATGTEAPGAREPGYAEVFAPDAPDPVDPAPTAAGADGEGWALAEEDGQAWRMSVDGYRVEDGVLTMGYWIEAEDVDTSAPPRRPDLFPDGLTMIDPATGAVVPELRVGDAGESEPLWSIAWPLLRHGKVFGELAFAAPEGGTGELVLDAGAFGDLPVRPLG
jgi:hypothetical protein